MNRRKFLAITSGGVSVGLAGCTSLLDSELDVNIDSFDTNVIEAADSNNELEVTLVVSNNESNQVLVGVEFDSIDAGGSVIETVGRIGLSIEPESDYTYEGSFVIPPETDSVEIEIVNVED